MTINQNKDSYSPAEVQRFLEAYSSGKWHYDARRNRRHQASPKKLESLAEQGEYWLNTIPENVRTKEVNKMIQELSVRNHKTRIVEFPVF